METKYYKFINRVFEITTQYSFFYEYAKAYCVNEESTNYQIAITKDEILSWKKDHKECEKQSLEFIEILCVLHRICLLIYVDNCCLIHGSSFYLDNINNGFILIAPSGTGKSTHAHLLNCMLKDRFHYINDDKPFLSYLNNKFYLYGSPWNGKERLSSDTYAVLKAVFIVKQAKNNKVTKIASDKALETLLRQIYIPQGEEASEKVFELIIKLSKEVPIYMLECNMLNEASETSYSVIKEYLE